MAHKLLSVDDELMILDMLRLHFEGEGYIVLTAQTAGEALEKLSQGPDLILLDINMPGMDGLELCGQIRGHIACPILFLSARVGDEDKIQGLAVGGDDYITKPFHMPELLARVAAHLRREQRHATATSARFEDGLVIDYAGRAVYHGQTPLDFSGKEFEIIRLLSMNAGMVFDRERIYEKLWGYEGEGDSIVVKEHIRKIRNKLAAQTEKQYIETVWGVGYKWVK